MNRKKSAVVSSTPHPNKADRMFRLLEDIGLQVSPITMPSQQKVSTNPKPTTLPAEPRRSQHTKVAQKRRINSKEKAAPANVAADVLKELGVDGQDVCNNLLSHSRNLYNMFPEPIILDSDDETPETPKKAPKKPKQDSKVIKSQSLKKNDEKINKGRIPEVDDSKTSRSTGLAADRKSKKQSSVLPCVQGSSKDPNTTTKPRYRMRKNQLNQGESPPSVIQLDDDDDTSAYQPTSCFYPSVKQNKIRGKARLSLEVDEKFPIEWSAIQKKTGNKKATVSEPVNGLKQNCSPKITGNKNENGSEVRKNIEPLKGLESNESVEIIENEDDEGRKENPPLISHFQDVTFKLNNASGGIIARCLKTDQNDIGYLEVPANKPFNGQRTNITFVVIEGQAKVVHKGKSEILSSGDMIHIRDDSGYTFESAGTRHVRFLYIKAH